MNAVEVNSDLGQFQGHDIVALGDLHSKGDAQAT